MTEKLTLHNLYGAFRTFAILFIRLTADWLEGAGSCWMQTIEQSESLAYERDRSVLPGGYRSRSTVEEFVQACGQRCCLFPIWSWGDRSARSVKRVFDER